MMRQNDSPLEMKYLDAKLRLRVSGTSFAAPKALVLRSQVLSLVAKGYSTRDIARRLNIDQRTVIAFRTKLIRSAKGRTPYIASQSSARQSIGSNYHMDLTRPPVNAEYVLYLLLQKEERTAVIGDLVECYSQMVQRFDKRRADIWFYKQVAGSLLPLLRRALLKIGAFIWLGRVLQRLIS